MNLFIYFQTFVISAVQGVTELFPISSLGHAIVIPYLFHFNLNLTSESLLPFLTSLHLGTAIALLIYFRKDWIDLLKSINNPHQKHERKLLGLIVAATIPAGVLGLLFEKKLREIFTNVQYVAIFLIVNGVLLFLGERLRKKTNVKDLSTLSYGGAFFIGMAQALALLPGISRSGITLIGGLISGLTHEAAARLSFLLATPIILAAALLEVPKIFKPDFHSVLLPSLIGGVIAGLFAYASTHFLMKYFKKHEVNSLFPFGVYCVALGLLTLAVGAF